MKRSQWIALSILAIGALGLIWLARGSRQPPLLPGDLTHAVWDGPAVCETCHGTSGAVPRTAKHPLGFDCLRCHGRR